MEYILFRKNSRGAGLRDNPPATVGIKNRPRTVLLVHGYNVSEDEAEKSLDQFQRNLSQLDRTLANDIVATKWPGDSRTWILRALMYPWIVKPAKESGKKLAEYLHKKGPSNSHQELIIIAHSLGCRLVLETLAELTKLPADSRCQITLLLMAAAAPVKLVQYDLLIQSGIKLTNNSNTVFFSHNDRVLKYTFHIGQFIAPGEYASEAIGLRGNPIIGTWANQVHMMKYGHGDYWDNEHTVDWVAYLLGSPVAKPRIERSEAFERLIVARPQPPERPMPGKRRMGR